MAKLNAMVSQIDADRKPYFRMQFHKIYID